MNNDIITLNGVEYIKLSKYKKDTGIITGIKEYCEKLRIFCGDYENIVELGDITNLFRIETKYFIEDTYNACFITYKKWSIIMFPISVLNYFIFEDHLYIDNLCNSVNYSWGGISFDPNSNINTVSFTDKNKRSAKISRVSFFHSIDYNTTIKEIITIMREYYHRVFQGGNNVRGTGINYNKKNNCPCIGCTISDSDLEIL